MVELTNIEGLRDLRVQFEESTPEKEWPEAAASQLLLLSDVCAILGLADEETHDVLGDRAYIYLSALLDDGGRP